MTNQEFKKVGRLLKELYRELEAEALQTGVDIFGEQYSQMQGIIREKLLAKMNFTLEEYVAARDRTVNEQKAARKTKDKIVNEQVTDLEMEVEEKLTEEEVLDLIDKNQKAPVVTHKTTNEIVRETTIEKPTVVKETKTVIEREEFDDQYLMAEIGYLNDRVDKIPEPKELNEEALMDKVTTLFGDLFEHNIDTLGMPDFRKLAMGLQGQVDGKINGIGVTNIHVSDTEPASPAVNDIWIDTNAYTYRAVTSTYTIVATDYMLDCSGTFTITLPTAVGFTGEYIIKNTSTGTITVDTTSSQTIDSDLTMTIVEEDSMVVRSTGTNWIII